MVAARSIERVGNLLRKSTAKQVGDYKSSLGKAGDFYDPLLLKLLRSAPDAKAVTATASRFFNGSSINFAAIDGSRFVDSFFDLVVFFGGAYASLGESKFSQDGSEVTYGTNFLEEGQSVSSCVPLYVSQIPELDHSFFAESKGTESKPMLASGDEAVIDNSRIADSIMHFAEYFLALLLLIKSDSPPRLLLFDRSLSGDQAALVAGTSNPILWERCALNGLTVDGGKVDTQDLAYGRYLFENSALDLPPRRGPYLPYRVLRFLSKNGSMTADEIADNLNFSDIELRGRVARVLATLNRRGFLASDGDNFALLDRYKSTQSRLNRLVELVGSRLFEESAESIGGNNPMKIEADGAERWLTTIDLNFLTLFCLYRIMQIAWESNVLVVGMTKDTAARDFKRHFVPICHNCGLLTLGDPDAWVALPYTDRMVLQAVSMANLEKIKVPWAIVEYDTAFKTMIPDVENGGNHVRGAIRDKIAPERTFVKTYVQLAQAQTDPKLRSSVLAIDRLAYPGFDDAKESTMTFLHKQGKVQEEVTVILYKDNKVNDPIGTMLQALLSRMTDINIPEAFGHNAPLFFADKIAKWHTGSVINVVKSVRNWIMNDPDLREYIYYMTSLRERRERFERARRSGT